MTPPHVHDPSRLPFEELDRRATPLGELVLRRRIEPSLGVDVYEVRLGEEYLMSSLFTVAEEELAHLTLAAVEGSELRVVVGGLGLGYTARAALDDPRVSTLTVIDALGEVIGWHRDGLLPHSQALTDGHRCYLVQDDFFRMVAEDRSGPFTPTGCDAILLDVDHSPRHHLHPTHAALYQLDGLQRLASLLRPGGAFGMWSDDPPDDDFLESLRKAFGTAQAEIVRFPNPLTGGTARNTVYVATTSRN